LTTAGAAMLRDMAIQRMDHVGVVVDDLRLPTAFFAELGMELEGEMPVEAPADVRALSGRRQRPRWFQ
jgi:hypothetical protein